MKNMADNNSDLIFSEIKERLAMQFQSIDGLDAKAGNIMVFVSVILSIILQKDIGAIYLFPIASLFISMALAFQAYGAKEYRRDPNPEALVDKYLNSTYAKTRDQLISNFKSSYVDNKQRIAEKAKNINYSLFALMYGISILIILVVGDNI